MTGYLCDVCKTFEYDDERGNSKTSIAPGTKPKDFPNSWECPICKANKTHLQPIKENKNHPEKVPHKDDLNRYLGEWIRQSDDFEKDMEAIHKMSLTGESIISPMRTQKKVISWDDILIKGAQLEKFPLDNNIKVNVRTIIGPKAKKPLVIETPILITHMSFGAISRESKIALAKGAAAVKTAVSSGEGGILEDSLKNSYKYIFEYVPNEYSVTEENLKRVDAIEIKIGQSTKPGMGGQLMAEKVTEEIAKIRGMTVGQDIEHPSKFKDINNKQDLKKKVEWLRKNSGGRPIGIKLAAGNIEKDLEIVLFAKPDFITIDGRPGATAASPEVIKNSTSIPTLFAVYRARQFLNKKKIKNISLIVAGGLRTSPDFIKALVLGADAVAIGTAALIAIACQQYRMCNTGMCPVGVTTQNPKLRARLRVDISAKKLENFLSVSTEELKKFAKITGNKDVHELNIKDLCTTNSEISGHTKIEHV